MESMHIPLADDARSRRVVLVSHCILNANAKVEGLSLYAGVHPLIGEFAERGIGIIQMPCAEFSHCGMKRWGQTREQYDHPSFVALCEGYANDAYDQVLEYQRCGYEVLGVVGIEGSPTCGVTRSASGDWGGEPESWDSVVATAAASPQPGIHIAALQARLEPLGLTFTGIDESDEGHRVAEVIAALIGNDSAT